MIYLAWTAFGIALLVVAGLWLLIRFGAREEHDFEIDEEVMETDLRRDLSDISFGRRP